MAGFEDPFAPMPKEWWQLPATVTLVVRYRYAQLGDEYRRLAFADEFHSALSVYGTRYLNLAELTRIDAYQPESDPDRWWGHRMLTGRHPGLLTTVIGRNGPRSVWLALPLSELTGPVAGTLRQVHHRLTTPPDRHQSTSPTGRPDHLDRCRWPARPSLPPHPKEYEMTEITATMRRLLDQVGVSTLADLTGERAADPHNPLLQLVDNLLKELLDDAARAEKTLTGRLRDLDRTLQSELNLLRQGQTPTGLPAYHARESEPERFRLAAAVDTVTMLAPLRRRLEAGQPPATTTRETTDGR